MQPPPQAGPAGTGGPPRMGMTTTPYWRKRTPPPSAMAPPPVQPVTDPFAFGRMTPQNVPPTTVPKAPILATPSPSPSLYPQPAALASSHGDGAQASLPMGAVTSYSNVPTPPVQSGNFTNNMASPPIGQLTLGHSTGSSLQNVAGGLENAYGPLPGRSQNMDMNSSSSIAPPLQSHPSSANQQTTAPWSSTQATPPTSSQHVPAAQHPAYTAPYYSPPYLEVSHLPPQNSDPSYFSAPQRTAPATFPLGGGSGQVQQHGISPYSSVMHTDYMQNQNPDHISWFNPPHPEPLKQAQPPHTMQTGTLHNAIQTGAPGPLPNTIQTMAGAPLPSTIQTGTPAPLANTIQTRALAPLPYTIQTRAPAPLSSPNTIQTGAPFSALENRPQSEPAGSLDQATSDTDSGTISMFFKGDEAENVEIPSTDQQHMPRNQSMDTAYHQNLGCQGSMHPFTDLPAAPNMASLLPLHPSAQQTSLFQSASGFHDSHVPGKAGDTENQPTEARAGSELPYDNVENIEVLPNEPPNSSLISSGGIPETFRYGPVLGSALPKSTVGRPEGGPNLEAPDALPHPVRSDSVSSNYSNLSHRSLPTSVRPQELEGTFIQKEIGRLERESSTGFFKQIDSSPLTGDVITHGMTQNPYHGSLSQPPTPSPPKPTGIFQASVNSSFEPVRSQAGVKAAEVDQSKVVDVRENQKLPPTSSHSAGLAASPGNLEQPPDNLETIFSGKSNAEICAVNSGHHFPTGTMLDNISLLLEKRPSSRAHGSNKKCESPATTLWAQGELPNFGGNVLLAPPAPALYVPPKPQTEVIQPPEDGSLEVHPGRPDQSQFSASPEEHTSSENLENPPKIGDDEHTQSQASSGYASLLSSPPTESLQNQPVLIAAPSKSYNLTQPINFSLSLPNQIRNVNPAQDFSTADKPLPTSAFAADQSAAASLVQLGPPIKAPSSSNPAHKLPSGSNHFSESFSNHPTLLSSSSQIPLNLATENQKTANTESIASESTSKPALPSSGAHLPVGNGAGMYAPPVSSSGGGVASAKLENAVALDFTIPRMPANHNANGQMSVPNRPPTGGLLYTGQSTVVPNFPPGPDDNKQVFYQQVTKDVQAQPSVETSRPGPGAAPEYMAPASYPPAPSVQTIAGANKPSAYPQQTGAHVPSSQNPAGLPYSGTAEPAAKYSHPEHPPYPTQPATSTSAAVNPMQPAGYPDPARPPASHTPQQADPYYYYQGYGAYPSAYQPPYPTVDPRASHLYYQDSYGAYDPAYRQYSNSSFVNPAKYYQEPERPSSRSSHCSDRPPSRQGYTAPANYYDYYQSQYEYGDPTRWDRYPGAYDPGYRDPRNNYWNYTYREDAYGRKVPYAYTSRYDVYEDRWQYDPRYVGGFDDEPDARRDLTKDDFDRRSVHSEHSARSVHSEHSTHSRRSSFSSRSQQSQVYKSEQDLAANAYGGQVPNPPLEDYSYSLYPNDYSTQQSLDSYQYSYPVTSEWQPVEQVPSRSLTPEKFGSPHVCARFGPGGHLIKVLPNLPSDGQPTLVEIHNMEVIMQNSPEQEQMRGFPGPLVKDETHKVDVINFAQNKAKECSQNENLLDKESARLLWDFIVLMCRQNGTVVGTDIAELLLQDHKTVWLPGKSPNEANLIDFTNEPLELEEESVASQLSFLTDTLPNSGVVIERETERFRELLLFGRKKDALESAMKHGLWGHALLLSSKMDSRTHARVMTRFANSLPINDPLQTVYQLLSGRMPAAATCCGDEKWGDWRPHLAMVLSNLTSNVDVPTRTIVTMGDTLASRGLLEAAHFCYVMAQAGFGVYTKKTTKLVLIGSNHSLPFAKFATNEAIQRTEAYEYAQSLGAQTFSLPNIQVFKFIYACRLAEYGLSAQAFHYCEVISKTVVKHPSYYSPVLVGQLLEVSSHLRFFDPQLKEKPEQELFVEPPWLLRLRHLDMQMKQGSVVYNTGRTTPQQYACSTPSSEQDLISQSEGIAATHEGPAASDNPLLTNFLPNVVPNQGVQLALPGPDHTAALYPPPEPPSSFPPQTFLPSLAPPAAGQGPVPVSSESVAAYTPAPMGSVPSPLQPAEFISQEQWIQDPALQRPPTNSPTKTTFYDSGFDFYGEMAKMAPGQRSRTVSQSSSHMRRTRTISESSTHSVGSTRRSSIGVQPSPPPIPEMKKPEPKKEPKPSSSSQGSGRSWLGWLMRKGKNEAHLPDDRNKSIVWDEAKQRWINLDEPEGEENKPLPPPPSSMPKLQAQVPSGPGGLSAPPNSSVNMFSIKAGGARTRYVDVLNPGGNKPTTSVLPPADLFAPLAPIPTNLFVPNAVPEEAQPPVGSEAEMAQLSDQPGIDGTAQTQFLNAAPGLDLLATNHEDVPSGELSRSSSQSSLSREVSQHFHQVFAAGRHSFSVFFPSFLHLFCTNVACFLSHPS
ncbi:protein transport protein Sec16A isoform X1 [Bufo gargarizans]|uniref:protein transport protein Sec16A isoform X1 n=1 Tax=Bufo gargarizans TaxID=30331 RepID=UPI001CF45FE0|nr:protein transport protein Sec16A isoform X1 [Bufo gargarizans]XP_044125141.1 protein transport protein Sec16A isoform X1 [Bufo gargarizans]XP_044125142.1 protein transport protein Sec16A isoform X1 [Bufo gargarizans]